MKKVALIKGNSRYENIINAMNLIKPEVLEKLKKRKNVIIKPNCVSDSVQLAATHVDTIRAVLDFVKPHCKKITIAEGSAYSTERAFKNFDYFSLKNNYDVEFYDLNNDDFEEFQINNLKLGISKKMLNCDCVISLSMLKTHNAAIATFGIKNIAVGSLIKRSLFTHRIPVNYVRQIFNRLLSIRNDKAKIHQGPKAINKNIFEIYKILKPDISIIDGFEGMEGEGPVDGTPVKARLAIAGTNAVAVDITAAQLIGISPYDIGYLYYAMNYEKIFPKDVEVIGNATIKNSRMNFKMHPSFKKQLQWK